MQLFIYLLKIIRRLPSSGPHGLIHRHLVQPTNDAACSRLLIGQEGGDVFFFTHACCHESISRLIELVFDVLNSSVTKRHNSNRRPGNHENIGDDIENGLCFSSPRRAIDNTNPMRECSLYRNLLILVALKR